jgi:hypothetical protein
LHRAPDQAEALERAGWLNELAEAISQAQKLAWRLGFVEGDSDEARDLYARLEAVRGEIETLRFGDWVAVRKEVDPIWLENLLNGTNLVPSAATNSSDALR